MFKYQLKSKIDRDTMDEIESKLLMLGAERKAEEHITCTYFDNDDYELLKSNKFLRIKNIQLRELDNEAKDYLAYDDESGKHAFLSFDDEVTYNFIPNSVDSICGGLGYDHKTKIYRRRVTYKLGVLTIYIDNVNHIGAYVTISHTSYNGIDEYAEFVKELATSVFNFLNLSEIEERSYYEIYTKFMKDNPPKVECIYD